MFFFLHVSGTWKKLPEMAPHGARKFFINNPDLADILGRTDLDFDSFYFFDFWDPKFPDLQVPYFLFYANVNRV